MTKPTRGPHPDPGTGPLEPGSLVGARRWPMSHAHPDCWGKPWSGVVLEPCDPRAWAGTMAFPAGVPGKAEVLSHLLRVGWPTKYLPVLWDFGSYTRVWWERVSGLRPYSQDLREWRAARKRASGHCSRSSAPSRLGL